MCLYLSVEALTPSATYPLFMPYRDEHLEFERDIRNMCTDLEVEVTVYNLKDIVLKFTEQTGCGDKIQIGNFAARLRTAYLYQHAAQTNSLVINTSNRTETMVGYCTKWGDQAGDISPIGNLFKTEIYDIARVLGVPREILDAVPSAGFYTGQEDEKELGMSYPELDEILYSIDSKTEKDIDPDNLEKVKRMIELSQHKRKLQCLPDRLRKGE